MLNYFLFAESRFSYFFPRWTSFFKYRAQDCLVYSLFLSPAITKSGLVVLCFSHLSQHSSLYMIITVHNLMSTNINVHTHFFTYTRISLNTQWLAWIFQWNLAVCSLWFVGVGNLQRANYLILKHNTNYFASSHKKWTVRPYSNCLDWTWVVLVCAS